jgi:uncharacterized membrane-anchored protein YhcB (DUF1043 family)
MNHRHDHADYTMTREHLAVTSASLVASQTQRRERINRDLIRALEALMQRYERDGIPNESMPAVSAARAALALAMGEA